MGQTDRYDVIIFDGNNTAHKAYHVNKYLSTNIDGEEIHTGMMYGFLYMMCHVYEQFAHDKTKVIVAWDSIDSADSNKLLDENYKGNRKPKNEQELLDKIRFEKLMANTKGLLSTLNILQFIKHKVEADDLIATLSHKISNRGKSVLIVTEDKDYRQLITEQINLYGITQKIVWDIDTFKYKSGLFKPSHFVDYLAICGDSIDGFSGVQGFGHAKAMQLLTDRNFIIHDSISMYILKNPDSINDLDIWTEKTKQSFINGLSDLETSYKLAKLNSDIDSAMLVTTNHYHKIDVFEAMIISYRMNSMRKKLNVFEQIMSNTNYWKNHYDMV